MWRERPAHRVLAARRAHLALRADTGLRRAAVEGARAAGGGDRAGAWQRRAAAAHAAWRAAGGRVIRVGGGHRRRVGPADAPSADQSGPRERGAVAAEPARGGRNRVIGVGDVSGRGTGSGRRRLDP